MRNSGMVTVFAQRVGWSAAARLPTVITMGTGDPGSGRVDSPLAEARRRRRGTAMYRLHCPACDRPGVTRTNRREVQALANTHNQMIHRGQPVATVRMAGWNLFRKVTRQES
jgi:hypothetical protein